MAIKIVVSDKVGFKVKLTINDATGRAQSFEFGLTCKRLESEVLHARIKGDGDGVVFADFMAEVILDWTAVVDADDAPVPYSESAWRALCKTPGVGKVSFDTYCREVGAKEKN